ncbi:unnamed protein product, partial [marine sediment metagenome]
QAIPVKKKGKLYYIPWHATEYKKNGIRVKFFLHLYGVSFDYVFRIEKNEILEQIKPYETRVEELEYRRKKLIERSKEIVYTKLKPILSSYPQGEIPKRNPSDINLRYELYTIFRKRITSELKKEKKKGTYTPNAVIKNIPRDTYYSKEKIIEEVKICNFEKGRYELVKKVEDITIAFANFLAKHSPSETADLIIELSEVNDIFTKNLYSGLIPYIHYYYPEREKTFYEFEKEIVEKLFLNEGEHIIAHFKGKVRLP